MELYKQKLNEWNTYFPPLTKQDDFEFFWQEALEESKKIPLMAEDGKINYPIRQANVYKVIYRGMDGTPIHSYLLLPDTPKPHPCIIRFHGYGGSKGSPAQYMHWLIQGYAVLAVDCRGHGETGDSASYSRGHAGSWATMGLGNKREYYYFRVYTDAIRAVDFIMNHPAIDPNRVAVMGASFGGGISLAIAALDERPCLFIADVPNMCHIELALEQKLEGSLTYIESYLNKYPDRTDKVLTALSYFDHLNFADRIKRHIRISVSLKDVICPPLSVMAVYNRIQSQKSLLVYPYSGHDIAAHPQHVDSTIEWIAKHL
ncbi:acetylxylan esterase [Metabacillus sp. 113a]|uniref:acetylxylan esterase n=1 Tax=Metabacillus sp. 113a TaxID=3404706 RepID=UPI003CFB50B5